MHMAARPVSASICADFTVARARPCWLGHPPPSANIALILRARVVHWRARAQSVVYFSGICENRMYHPSGSASRSPSLRLRPWLYSCAPVYRAPRTVQPNQIWILRLTISEVICQVSLSTLHGVTFRRSTRRRPRSHLTAGVPLDPPSIWGARQCVRRALVWAPRGIQDHLTCTSGR